VVSTHFICVSLLSRGEDCNALLLRGGEEEESTHFMRRRARISKLKYVLSSWELTLSRATERRRARISHKSLSPEVRDTSLTLLRWPRNPRVSYFWSHSLSRTRALSRPFSPFHTWHSLISRFKRKWCTAFISIFPLSLSLSLRLSLPISLSLSLPVSLSLALTTSLCLIPDAL